MKTGDILNGTYEILEQIGSGGSGIVYRARHLRLQTDVVVKKMKDEAVNRSESRQEADILIRLKHPYLPRIYDFIEIEDGIYTVMDLIQGEDLYTAVRRGGRFSGLQVMKWAHQLGEALSYLHSQEPSVIHSDIKPSNIMLTGEGNVCLIDFNVALALGGSMELAAGISAGFSPPEQYSDPALYEKIIHSGTDGADQEAGLRQAGAGLSGNGNMGEGSVSGEGSGSAGEAGADGKENSSIGDSAAFGEKGGQKTNTADDRTELLSVSEREAIRRRYGEGRQAGSGTGLAASGDQTEYARYFGRGIDTRSDIYSLGVTLYFLLTGIEPPPDFERRLSTNRPDMEISEGFALILEKMTKLSPDERYQNGGEFLSAVRNCYKLDRRYRSMRRKQAVMQAAALCLLAAGIVLLSGGMYLKRKEENAAYYRILQQAEQAMERYDYEEAGRLIGEAKEILAVRVDAYTEEAYILYLSGQYDACISLCENDINTTPFRIETEADEELLGDLYYILGNAYIEKGDYDNARAALAEALQLSDRNGLYYRDYAVALAKLGQVDAAQLQLEEGIRRGLAQDSIYMAQGEIAYVQGAYGQAAEYLEQVIRITEDGQMKRRAILLCTEVYRAVGVEALDREIALLEQYRGQFGDSGGLVMAEYLAGSYARKAEADQDTADVYYRKALELFTMIRDKGYETYQMQENMVILYENMDSFAEAEELLAQMAERYPERYEVYKRWALLEADRQQMKENGARDYRQMAVYYEKAEELYEGKEQDPEMDMLAHMMKELKDEGWLE